MKRILIAPLVVWALYLLKANVWFRLYPAVIVAFVFGAFAVSLFRTPLCEVFARKWGKALDECGVRYCRKATIVWTVFLALHLAVTIATVFLDETAWAFYNGFLAYVLLGLMFGGEYLVRRRAMHG